MKKPEDKRVKRTNQALVETMFALLESNRYDDITVRDICDNARVHRATFYKHFKDKNHFFEFCISTMFEEFFPALAGEDFSLGRKEYLMRIINRVLDFLDHNSEMVKLITDATHSTTLTDAIHKALSSGICNKMAENEKKGVVFLIPIKILGEYYAGAFIALIKWWVFNDTKITKEEFSGYIDALIDQSVYSKSV